MPRRSAVAQRSVRAPRRKAPPLVVPVLRPGPEGGARDRNRKEKAARLAHAALRLFLAHGVDAVAIEDMTHAAGMAKASFYRYFPGKTELVTHLFSPLRQSVEAALDTAVRALSVSRTRAAQTEAYAAVSLALAAAVAEQPDVARLYLQERRGPPTPSRAPIHALSRRLESSAVQLTLTARKAGLLRASDPVVSAHAVLGAVEALLMLHLDGTLALGPMHVAQELTELVLDGLRPGPRR